MRRPVRWLASGALVAAAPKCALCVLVYLGLGVGGPELCGGTASQLPTGWLLVTTLLGALAVLSRRPKGCAPGAAPDIKTRKP